MPCAEMARAEGLGRTGRILKRAEFLRTQDFGTKLYCRNFLLFVRERQSDAAPTEGQAERQNEPQSSLESRLGVTITRKVHKRAVQRNRLRRRIRELFRVFRSQLSRPIDLVVIARADATRLDLPEIERQIVGALQRKKLLS